jgi:hypothetical protein
MDRINRKKLFIKAGLDPALVDQEETSERNLSVADRKSKRDEIAAAMVRRT